jgi:hypothetical protein
MLPIRSTIQRICSSISCNWLCHSSRKLSVPVITMKVVLMKVTLKVTACTGLFRHTVFVWKDRDDLLSHGLAWFGLLFYIAVTFYTVWRLVVEWVMNYKFKGFARKLSGLKRGNIQECPWGTEETTKVVSQSSKYRGRDSNRGPPPPSEYVSLLGFQLMDFC